MWEPNSTMIILGKLHPMNLIPQKISYIKSIILYFKKKNDV